MSQFTHSICDPCWIKRERDRIPHRLKERTTEICCFCGVAHNSGIYVREQPHLVLCKGDCDH